MLALVLALGVGIVAGALLHGCAALRDTLDPLFATYYAVPVFAFYPFFIVVFGLGDLPQVLIAIHARRGRGDRQHAERPRPRAARAAEDRARSCGCRRVDTALRDDAAVRRRRTS